MADQSVVQPKPAAETPSSESDTEMVMRKGNDKPSTGEQDGGYGWVCVICQLLITASTWGVNGVSQKMYIPVGMRLIAVLTLAAVVRRISLSLPLDRRISWNVRRSPIPSSAACHSHRSRSSLLSLRTQPRSWGRKLLCSLA